MITLSLAPLTGRVLTACMAPITRQGPRLVWSHREDNPS